MVTVFLVAHVRVEIQSCIVADQPEQRVGNQSGEGKAHDSNDLAGIQSSHVQILRGPASDQPDDEGALRGSDCVAGEAAGGAGFPGEQAGRGPEPHGGADPSKPGAEQETRRRGEDRGSSWGLDGEVVPFFVCVCVVGLFLMKTAESQCCVPMFITVLRI